MPIPFIRLAVADDHVLFRKTLIDYLSGQNNIEPVIQASDVTELISKLKYLHADLLLLDIFMPDRNGNEALKRIRNDYPDMKILILSMSTDLELVSEMLDAGIHGYLSKGDEPENLLQAIRGASEGRIYRNKLFTDALYWSRQNNIATCRDDMNVSLNEREKRILQLIWEEKSNKEIANELYLGVRSVEKIRQDMKEKIQVKSTVGLLKYAIQKKIIEVDVYIPGLVSSKH